MTISGIETAFIACLGSEPEVKTFSAGTAWTSRRGDSLHLVGSLRSPLTVTFRERHGPACGSADANGFTIDDLAARTRDAVLLNIPAQQCHVLHVGAEHDIERVAQHRHRADYRIER